MSKEIRSLTETLLNYNSFLTERFEKAKTNGDEPDFFSEVKPFADKVKMINDVWLDEVTQWISQNRPKHLHISQIISMHDHLEKNSIQAFYPSTSKKLFLDAAKSIDYVLRTLISKMNE